MTKSLSEASFIHVLFSIRLQLLPSLMSRDWKARAFCRKDAISKSHVTAIHPSELDSLYCVKLS